MKNSRKENASSKELNKHPYFKVNACSLFLQFRDPTSSFLTRFYNREDVTKSESVKLEKLCVINIKKLNII